MAANALDDVVNKGSGRAKLPSRLRNANFAATVKAAVTAITTVLPLGGGLRFKSVTTTQMNALTGMAAGDTYYNSTAAALVVYTGAAWKLADGTTIT